MEKYDTDIIIALIMNDLIKTNIYEKDELNGIRKFLVNYVDKEEIMKIADDMDIDIDKE